MTVTTITAEKLGISSSSVLIHTPPQGIAQNVLLILHGLGATNEPFHNLATQLSLPQTTCISLQGPTPLPFDLSGFHWGDDILFDQRTGAMDVDPGFKKALDLVGEKVIKTGLISKCGFNAKNVFILGHGQGGMVGLATAAKLALDEKTLGGVISIGGPAPSTMTTASRKVDTPVLVCGGQRSLHITATSVGRIKDLFKLAEYTKWQKAGDGMPQSREEMLPLMKFLAANLAKRMNTPQGWTEVT
ncbi:hypothetical protein MMC25_006696 [Agyrium rufum]|nr:hypothetical protein [Agyrium rufum]